MIWNDLFQSFRMEVPQTESATHNSKRNRLFRNKVDSVTVSWSLGLSVSCLLQISPFIVNTVSIIHIQNVHILDFVIGVNWCSWPFPEWSRVSSQAPSRTVLPSPGPVVTQHCTFPSARLPNQAHQCFSNLSWGPPLLHVFDCFLCKIHPVQVLQPLLLSWWVKSGVWGLPGQVWEALPKITSSSLDYLCSCSLMLHNISPFLVIVLLRFLSRPQTSCGLITAIASSLDNLLPSYVLWMLMIGLFLFHINYLSHIC